METREGYGEEWEGTDLGRLGLGLLGGLGMEAKPQAPLLLLQAVRILHPGPTFL